MKAKYLIVFFLFIVSHSYAQEPADALRYSYLTGSGGTARNQAIGGAGASLGGEFSSLFINPAGLGFYNTGDFVLTPGYALKTDKSNYLNSNENATHNNFNLGATGIVFSSPSNSKSIKSFSFAIGINKTADFNNHIYYKGTNTTSSYSEKYLEELINNNVTDPNAAATDYPYGSSLAFNTYLIDTLQNTDGSLAGYKTLANPASGLIQENTIDTKGGITDLAFGAGFNLQNKWYFGGTLTLPFLNYHRNATYKESDASGISNNNFNYFQVNESLQTKGVGINGKFGVIFKPVDYIRLGLAIHTPTFYQLTDNYSTEIITDLEGYGGPGIKKQSSLDLTNGQSLQSKYNLSTPLRVILSGSYVFRAVENVQQQRGFITADVEYVNYKNASFHAADNSTDAKNYYSSLNKTMDNLYKGAINVRLGGEMKFNTIMFRLGGAYYGNPYQNQSSNLVKVSGGLGYRNKGIFLDLTYVYSSHKDINYPYLLQDKANVPAYLKNNAGNIVATIGFKL
ncbi:MAG: aromatic hydrocarbon degradation protein [Bacteroidota bacterium]|nr:aromatic hydrocarbon degradation protein [Bacteroidota bacterium]